MPSFFTKKIPFFLGLLFIFSGSSSVWAQALTPTFTWTLSPTPVPGTTVRFEDWEGPYPGGNHWAGYSTCSQANFVVNPASSGEPITVCYDNNPGDAHSGTYCLHSQITWNTCGPTQYAQEGIDSSYSGYGFPMNIGSSAPASLSIWLKSSVAGQQFVLYLQDSPNAGSGTILHTTHYQGGTGSNFLFTFTAANVWQNFVVPLTPGTSDWDFDPTTMNWGSILDIGTQFSAPPSCSAGQVLDVYMDDYSFLAPGTPNTSTFTPTGSVTYTPTPTFTPTGSATYTSTISPTSTPTFVAATGSLRFEDWEGPYPGGNHWIGFNPCSQANYVVNPASSGEPMTFCYDSTPGDAHSGIYCLHSQITWNACGPTQYAQEGIDSSYSGYGFPMSIAGSTPAYLSVWLKSSVAGQQFVLYLQDTSGPGSGTILHTTHYQGGTGSNFLFTFTAANVWQNFVVPLTPGTSDWDFDPTTMNWGAILDVGTYFSAPPGCAGGTMVDIYMDDYSFLTGTVNTPTFTPTGSWTPLPTNTPTITPTPTFTPTPHPFSAGLFEDWEGPYPSGNMWASYAACTNASYSVNPNVTNAALTVCYDNLPSDAHAGSYCLKSNITWTSASGSTRTPPDYPAA